MLQILYFFVSLFSSIVGGICGVGGGIIIKPVLDATGTMSVSCISFLSGCTVLSMSIISVITNRARKGLLDFRISTSLAVGGVVGGFLGKTAFDLIKVLFKNDHRLGAMQAELLLIITIGALLYSVFSHKIKTHSVKNILLCGMIGLILGMISAFLGIGGGPINLTVLCFFFSMDTKRAAANSLYIIMLSQLSSLFQTLVSSTVPSVSMEVLALMIVAGIAGGITGNRINRKITVKGVNNLFIAFMILVIAINTYNIVKFTVS